MKIAVPLTDFNISFFVAKKFTFEEKIIQEINLLSTEDDFMFDVLEIQKKYGFPVSEKDRLEDGTPKKLKSIWEKFYADIKILREKYLLSEAYQLALGIFVQEGHVNCKIHSEHWHLNPRLVTTETKNCITIKIYPETSFEDIKARWPEIAKIQKILLRERYNGRKNRRKNLKRDLEIYRLYKSGMKGKEIARMINKSFETTRLSYEDVLNIISRLKKRTKAISSKKS